MERVLLAKWIYISIFAGSFRGNPKGKTERRGARVVEEARLESV